MAQQRKHHALSDAKSTSRTPNRRAPRSLTEMRQKLRLIEHERDLYAKELTRKLAEEFNPTEVDQGELEDLLKHGSGVSLKGLIREIEKDAAR